MKRILFIFGALLLVLAATASGADREAKAKKKGSRALAQVGAPELPPELQPADALPLDENGELTVETHGFFSYLSSWACERCHERFETEPKYKHPPGVYATCDDCHDLEMKDTEDFFLTSSDSGCVGCHEGVLSSVPALHAATGRGFCTGCHDAHGSDRPGFVKGDDDGDLCLSCHADISERGTHAHEPAVGGMCTTCHGHHGAKHLDNLKYTVPQPCISCHTEVLDEKEHQHSANTEFGCVGCHDPHWSKSPKMLPKEAGGDLCLTCHRDDMTGRLVVHAPVAEGACLLCHDSHGSRLQSNLVSNPTALCTGCHPEKGTPKKTEHPALEIGCTAVCHDPHASDNHARLRAPIVELCTTCHVRYDDGTHVVRAVNGVGHPIGLKPHPYKEGRLVECTSCHNPHGTDNPRMWYWAEERFQLCAECHEEIPFKPNPRFEQWLEDYRKEQAVDAETLDAPIKEPSPDWLLP